MPRNGGSGGRGRGLGCARQRASLHASRRQPVAGMKRHARRLAGSSHCGEGCRRRGQAGQNMASQCHTAARVLRLPGEGPCLAPLTPAFSLLPGAHCQGPPYLGETDREPHANTGWCHISGRGFTLCSCLEGQGRRALVALSVSGQSSGEDQCPARPHRGGALCQAILPVPLTKAPTRQPACPCSWEPQQYSNHPVPHFPGPLLPVPCTSPLPGSQRWWGLPKLAAAFQKIVKKII